MQNKVYLESNKTKAVIFDLDGTIIDNMPYQINAWVEFASKYKIVLAEKEFKKKYIGLRSDAILLDLFGKNLAPEEIDSYRKERIELYKKLLLHNIHEIEGLTLFIQELKKRNINTALATTASAENRKIVLDSLNLNSSFDVISGGEHVINGKPDPEIYNLTAEKLHVNPTDCVVFEDSIPGIQAAKSAGMNVIALLTSHEKSELPEVRATINNFSEIEII